MADTGVSWVSSQIVRGGTAAARPASLPRVGMLYLAEDTGTLSRWDGDSYVDAAGGGGGVSDGDKGDVTVSDSGATWTVDADAITYAKMQNVSATSRVLGRITAGAGNVEELTAANLETVLGIYTIAPAAVGPTVNNSTTLVDDTGILFASLPVGRYALTGALVYTSNATANIKFSWSTSGTITAAWNWGTQLGGVNALTGEVSGAGAASQRLAMIQGYFDVTVTGTLQFRYAQGTANASNTTRDVGTWLRLTKVG